ncbi:MAG: hypothetical protein IMY82_01825 [Chloroflexi bacterium]|nr:hypothetical protein [Chloroflexota bacterium]
MALLCFGETLNAIEEIIEQARAMPVATAVIINKSNWRDIVSILTPDDLRSV